MTEQEQHVTNQLMKAIEGKGSGIGELAAAYVAAMAEIENVVKNANNPHFNSNYADLGAVLDTIKPVFAKHGLALLQAPGEMEGDKIALIGMLLHKSGQSVGFKTQLPIGPKSTAQAAGSAITYARRYQAAAVGGIAQVDDDGNAASNEQPRRAKRVPEAGDPPATAEEGSYSDKKTELIARIKATAGLAALEGIKVEVADLGDQVVADAYVAQKKEHKTKGAK